MSEPNREALQIWADAMEFGNYSQTTETLRIATENAGWAYCALGVACAEYAIAHRITEDIVESDEFIDYMPKRVADWLGLDREERQQIVQLNDDAKLTLPEIGTWIRDNLIKETSDQPNS